MNLIMRIRKWYYRCPKKHSFKFQSYDYTSFGMLCPKCGEWSNNPNLY